MEDIVTFRMKRQDKIGVSMNRTDISPVAVDAILVSQAASETSLRNTQRHKEKDHEQEARDHLRDRRTSL